MSKFCIDLEGMMLPDAIAALIEAWHDAQNISQAKIEEKDLYSISDLEPLLNRSRASVYRFINTSKHELNPQFDPAKLNAEPRSDAKEPLLVSSKELARWNEYKKTQKKIKASHAMKIANAEKLAKDGDSINLLGNFYNASNAIKHIIDTTRALIASGRLSADSKMPSVRDMSDRVGCHRNTALKAYQTLESDGILCAKLGSGFYVSSAAQLLCQPIAPTSFVEVDNFISHKNDQLKDIGIKALIERRGSKLAIRALLPSKRGYDYGRAYQRISLGMSASSENAQIAQKIAVAIHDLADSGRFDWGEFLHKDQIAGFVSSFSES